MTRFAAENNFQSRMGAGYDAKGRPLSSCPTFVRHSASKRMLLTTELRFPASSASDSFKRYEFKFPVVGVWIDWHFPSLAWPEEEAASGASK